MSKWTSQAGPKQTKDVNKALRSISTHCESTIEIRDWGRMQVTSFKLDGTTTTQANAILAAIGERFGWLVTRGNYKAIIAACDEAKAANPMPEIDKRTKAAL